MSLVNDTMCLYSKIRLLQTMHLQYPQPLLKDLFPKLYDLLQLQYHNQSWDCLHLDLFYPATEPEGSYPLVVYAHGGGWAAGSKKKARGKSSIGRTVHGLTEIGFCVAAVQYRLFNQGDTGIRDCVTDMMDAVRYLAKHGETLHLDPNRMFSFGDSTVASLPR